MHHLEGWSLFHAFYYAIITGASIGYGDFYPVTKPGQWFAVFFVPLMVVVFAAAMGQIGNAIGRSLVLTCHYASAHHHAAP